MSRERELLEQIYPYLGYSGVTGTLIEEIKSALAEPEQEPVVCNFIQREGRCDGFLWDECTVCGSTEKSICKTDRASRPKSQWVNKMNREQIAEAYNQQYGTNRDVAVRTGNNCIDFALYIAEMARKEALEEAAKEIEYIGSGNSFARLIRSLKDRQ